jgi:hypothetical protein
MRAINGYLKNGRFMPIEVIALPRHVQAVLVYSDAIAENSKEERLFWLKKLHGAVKLADGEEMPDFPRAQFRRELVNISDEE